ncbi:hypothetical protein COLO4_10512 [Corchorus olitorius]|uniref:HMA domain-containing protein n=1 Tax=Corchorus olitorius TaxID=93759 RepID=A0A1R3K875_9ROSI|nr:hypothetical protein COLO4_10512 [Corchorus olitorius]
MATPEGKPETKQQESKPEAKPEAKETEEQQDPPLKYKAWVLKVSIHCEGCKRKVEKTLRKIEVNLIPSSNGKNHVVEVCNVSKAHEGGSPCKSGGGAVKEAKPEHKQTVTVVVAGNQSPVAEKKGGAGANHSPPRQHHVHEHPTYYHAPLVYVTSYNTAYPSSSYTASYYASPPPYSYTYMHPGPMSEHPPSDFDTYSPYSSHPSDSFEMFSDENPNACSVM